MTPVVQFIEHALSHPCEHCIKPILCQDLQHTQHSTRDRAWFFNSVYAWNELKYMYWVIMQLVIKHFVQLMFLGKQPAHSLSTVQMFIIRYHNFCFSGALKSSGFLLFFPDKYPNRGVSLNFTTFSCPVFFLHSFCPKTLTKIKPENIPPEAYPGFQLDDEQL